MTQFIPSSTMRHVHRKNMTYSHYGFTLSLLLQLLMLLLFPLVVVAAHCPSSTADDEGSHTLLHRASELTEQIDRHGVLDYLKKKQSSLAVEVLLDLCSYTIPSSGIINISSKLVHYNNSTSTLSTTSWPFQVAIIANGCTVVPPSGGVSKPSTTVAPPIVLFIAPQTNLNINNLSLLLYLEGAVFPSGLVLNLSYSVLRKSALVVTRGTIINGTGLILLNPSVVDRSVILVNESSTLAASSSTSSLTNNGYPAPTIESTTATRSVAPTTALGISCIAPKTPLPPLNTSSSSTTATVPMAFACGTFQHSAVIVTRGSRLIATHVDARSSSRNLHPRSCAVGFLLQMERVVHGLFLFSVGSAIKAHAVSSVKDLTWGSLRSVSRGVWFVCNFQTNASSSEPRSSTGDEGDGTTANDFTVAGTQIELNAVTVVSEAENRVFGNTEPPQLEHSSAALEVVGDIVVPSSMARKLLPQGGEGTQAEGNAYALFFTLLVTNASTLNASVVCTYQDGYLDKVRYSWQQPFMISDVASLLLRGNITANNVRLEVSGQSSLEATLDVNFFLTLYDSVHTLASLVVQGNITGDNVTLLLQNASVRTIGSRLNVNAIDEYSANTLAVLGSVHTARGFAIIAEASIITSFLAYSKGGGMSSAKVVSRIGVVGGDVFILPTSAGEESRFISLLLRGRCNVSNRVEFPLILGSTRNIQLSTLAVQGNITGSLNDEEGRGGSTVVLILGAFDSSIEQSTSVGGDYIGGVASFIEINFAVVRGSLRGRDTTMNSSTMAMMKSPSAAVERESTDSTWTRVGGGKPP